MSDVLIVSIIAGSIIFAYILWGVVEYILEWWAIKKFRRLELKEWKKAQIILKDKRWDGFSSGFCD